MFSAHARATVARFIEETITQKRAGGGGHMVAIFDVSASLPPDEFMRAVHFLAEAAEHRGMSSSWIAFNSDVVGQGAGVRTILSARLRIAGGSDYAQVTKILPQHLAPSGNIVADATDGLIEGFDTLGQPTFQLLLSRGVALPGVTVIDLP